MDVTIGDATLHAVEHAAAARPSGTADAAPPPRTIVVLHGAGVDHRETEACLEATLSAASAARIEAGGAGWRRLYIDLPGHGGSSAPASIASAADMRDALLAFVDAVSPQHPVLLVGHSAGGYYARTMADAAPDRVAGLALLCPLLPDMRDIPEHRVVEGPEAFGGEVFDDYFVVHTQEMLDRFERFVAPSASLVDAEAAERIGATWPIPDDDAHADAFDGPMLVIAGREDSAVGWRAAADLAERHPRASLAVLDETGHALPHERPAELAALIGAWLVEV